MIFDPVKISLEDYIEADAIVITHEHLDHFDRELVRKLQKKTDALILTTPFVAQRLPGEDTRALEVGESFVIKDVRLYAERCEHPANQPLAFIISTENGITIYHPSDSEPFPEMTGIGERYKPDILVYFGTSLEKATQIARLVKPQVVVSYYADIRSQLEFAERLRIELPEANMKTIKRFEIYQYPE